MKLAKAEAITNNTLKSPYPILQIIPAIYRICNCINSQQKIKSTFPR